jgi:hypothetical protein
MECRFVQTNTYIFVLRKTTTIQLTVNNIFISILFDFRMQIIQSGKVAMAPSTNGKSVNFSIQQKVLCDALMMD